MGRIRTIKPEFFSHEKLYDLEQESGLARLLIVEHGLAVSEGSSLRVLPREANAPAGLEQGGIGEVFASAPDTSLVALRQVFLVKGFQRRQEKLLRWLLAHDAAPAALVELTVDQLKALALDAEGAELRGSYLDRRDALLAQAEQTEFTCLAFVDADGSPLAVNTLPAHLRRLSLVSLNVEINSSVCRGLLAVRAGNCEPTGCFGSAITPSETAPHLGGPARADTCKAPPPYDSPR